jgi:hypothetical protein
VIDYLDDGKWTLIDDGSAGVARKRPALSFRLKPSA